MARRGASALRSCTLVRANNVSIFLRKVLAKRSVLELCA